MNDIIKSNREAFLIEAYKLTSNGKSSYNDFQKELKTAQPKFGIVALAKQPRSEDGMIAMGQFTGDTDLKPIINECMGLLDMDKPDVVQCIQTPRARKLEAVTSKYHIKIYRDLVAQTDALVVKHRF